MTDLMFNLPIVLTRGAQVMIIAPSDLVPTRPKLRVAGYLSQCERAPTTGQSHKVPQPAHHIHASANGSLRFDSSPSPLTSQSLSVPPRLLSMPVVEVRDGFIFIRRRGRNN